MCVADRQGCGCVGHRIPGVSHLVACCDEPHVAERATLDFLPPSIDCKRGDRITVTMEDGKERVGVVDDVHKYDDGTFSLDVTFDGEPPIQVGRS